MMAMRVNEMNDEWSARRREALKNVESEDGLTVAGKVMGGAVATVTERLVNPGVNEGGLGMYESHTNGIFCKKNSFFYFLLTLNSSNRPLRFSAHLKPLGDRLCFIANTS